MNEGDPLRTVVVCVPGPAYTGVTDLVNQNIREAPDPEATRRQHRSLVRLMEASGARVVALQEPPGQPNATFTRDAALITRTGYVQLRMGLPARRSEPGWLAAALNSLGVPEAGRIRPPGTVEGGDVILAGDVAFVGRSGRTNDEGIRQLRALLGPAGYDVRVAEVPDGHLHLGGLMSLVGPCRVLAVAAFDRSFLAGFDVVEVPYRADGPTGANVICLGPDEVVANSADGSRPLEILVAAGVRVRALDLSEFRKGKGGPTCLILPVDRSEISRPSQKRRYR